MTVLVDLTRSITPYVYRAYGCSGVVACWRSTTRCARPDGGRHQHLRPPSRSAPPWRGAGERDLVADTAVGRPLVAVSASRERSYKRGMYALSASGDAAVGDVSRGQVFAWSRPPGPSLTTTFCQSPAGPSRSDLPRVAQTRVVHPVLVDPTLGDQHGDPRRPSDRFAGAHDRVPLWPRRVNLPPGICTG